MLLDTIRARLRRMDMEDDLSSAVEPEAAAESAALASLVESNIVPLDVAIEARRLLLSLSWYALLARWPDCDSSDLETFDQAVKGLLPSSVMRDGLVARQADWAAGALGLEVLGAAEMTQEPVLLDVAVTFWKLIVEATPTNDPELATRLSALSAALSSRSQRTYSQEDLNEAASAALAAVKTGHDHPDLADFQSGLGVVLQHRFGRYGDPKDLDGSVEACRDAVRLVRVGRHDRALLQSNLAEALRVRAESSRSLVDLAVALSAIDDALSVTSDDGPARARYLSTRGLVLRTRFDLTRSMHDLNDAIDALDQATAFNAQNAPGQARCHSNLGNLYWTRYARWGATVDLDRAVEMLRVAVEMAPREHAEWPLFIANLGTALIERFTLVRASGDLDEAIDRLRDGVDGAASTHRQRGMLLSNLGSALRIRFERLDTHRDIEDALNATRAAVEVTRDGHPERARYLSNLALVYGTRYRPASGITDLDNAIAYLRQAVDACPDHHPDQAMIHSNLGAMLRGRYTHSGEAEDLNHAISEIRTALKFTPDDHVERAARLCNLGSALRERFDCLGSGADARDAAVQFVTAADLRIAPPSVRIRAARSAADLPDHVDRQELARVLESAVRLLPALAPRHLERGDQYQVLGGLTGLASEAAALVMADERLQPASRATRALQLLETGRAVVLSQTLDIRGDLADLAEKDAALAQRFTRLRDLLDPPSVIPGTAAAPVTLAVDDRHLLGRQLDTLLEEIRALPDFTSFAGLPSAEELAVEAVVGPIVTFNISAHRTDALLLTTAGVSAVELSGLNPQSLAEQVAKFHGALRATADQAATFDTRRSAQADIREVLAWLWNVAAEPVLDALGLSTPPEDGRWPRVWWATSGTLAMLPLQAAGHHDRPGQAVLDRVVSSFTPTIRALRYARRQDCTMRSEPGRSLIVAMPTTPGAAPLLAASEEAALARNHLPSARLLAAPDTTSTKSTPGCETPTCDLVLALLPESAFAHFACHGVHDAADPTRSRLLLADHATSPLTVERLVRVHLPYARLAYLAACRTAFQEDLQLLDEAIHLAAAFQLAGFPHVVGTLWEISDSLAPTLAADFYAYLGSGLRTGAVDPTRAADALHHAVRAIRGRKEYRNLPSLWAVVLHMGA